MTSAGKSRETKLKDIQDKQRIRENRAERAREKVTLSTLIYKHAAVS